LDDLDEITLTRARRGDPAGFAALVTRYQRPVHAVLSRILIGVASAAEVDELAQEVFLRVYRALPGFESRGPGRLTRWVLTIAGRLAIDELRRPRATVTAIDAGALASESPPTDAHTTRRQLADAVVRALGALTPEQRATIVLREFHGFEYDELARALDVDLGTIKSRLSRARAALRALLAEHHHGVARAGSSAGESDG
jgi:RNA polymerase sigma-70 factor (ECF subfamily)